MTQMESLRSLLGRVQRVRARRETERPSSSTSGSSGTTLIRNEERCALCAGLGYLTTGPTPENGHQAILRECVCLDRTDTASILRDLSRIGALSGCSFAAGDSSGRSPRYDEYSRRLYAEGWNAALRYAAETDGCLALAGPSGCGKTYLAAAIVNHKLDQGLPALFLSAYDWPSLIRADARGMGWAGYDADLYEQASQTYLLALDDVPADMGPGSQFETICNLLRVRHTAGLPTVVVLRGDPNKLDPYLRNRIAPEGHRGGLYRLGRINCLLDMGAGRIPASLRQRMTLAQFRTDYSSRLTDNERASLIYVKQVVQEWARRPDGWILLTGDAGVGKTHLALAAAAAREAAGDDVFWTSVIDLLGRLRDASSQSTRLTDAVDAVKTAGVLALDDLGVELNSAFAEEKLYQVFQYRYDERLPTLITTRVIERVDECRPDIFRLLRSNDVVDPLLLLAPSYRHWRMG